MLCCDVESCLGWYASSAVADQALARIVQSRMLPGGCFWALALTYRHRVVAADHKEGPSVIFSPLVHGIDLLLPSALYPLLSTQLRVVFSPRPLLLAVSVFACRLVFLVFLLDHVQPSMPPSGRG